MAITINTNTIASQASLNVSRASNLLNKSLSRLSSGRRIVSPADDAGGLAVGMKLESALKRTQATKLNIQNGLSFLEMQDGALKVTGNIIDRMAELKSFYNDISKNSLDRENYNHEFNELQAQLNVMTASKFNGVSLFATTEPDNNPMKIITTEDGLTGKVEMNRTGLFENLKSKFGADSVLNTGENGSYRQFVGEYTADGVNDVNGTAGVITQDYTAGEIVYYNGDPGGGGAVVPANAGYFQLLDTGANVTSVTDAQGNVTQQLLFNPGGAGQAITDDTTATSNWLKIGNPAGAGGDYEAFAEAYTNAPEYSATKMQWVSSTPTSVGYLPGDVVKVKINNDTSGPGYRYYKVDDAAATVVANGGTTPGNFAASQALSEWIEIGQTAAATTNAAAGSRLLEPTRKNGNHADGDGINLAQGDKLYYQGEYYQYNATATSDTFDGWNGAATDGYTYMEDLIEAGAVVKLNGYVADKPRGGSPDADPNAFFEANADLKYIDRLPNSGMVRTNTIARAKDVGPPGSDGLFRTQDDQFYKGLHAGNDSIYGTADDYYQTTSSKTKAMEGYHIDADKDNNKDVLDVNYDLSDFSVADFVDYIQTLANFRAVTGGTMSRLRYSEEMLEENHMNLEAATSRIVDADMALESTKFARQNVLVQAGAAMVVQANQLSNIVLALLA